MTQKAQGANKAVELASHRRPEIGKNYKKVLTIKYETAIISM